MRANIKEIGPENDLARFLLFLAKPQQILRESPPEDKEVEIFHIYRRWEEVWADAY